MNDAPIQIEWSEPALSNVTYTCLGCNSTSREPEDFNNGYCYRCVEILGEVITDRLY